MIRSQNVAGVSRAGKEACAAFFISMHEQFANAFYGSAAWKRCRKEYWRMRGGLCERCLAKGLIVPGDEVHHKEKITPENISDPGVTLNFANLELLCKACHLAEHQEIRWRCDAAGHVEL